MSLLNLLAKKLVVSIQDTYTIRGILFLHFVAIPRIAGVEAIHSGCCWFFKNLFLFIIFYKYITMTIIQIFNHTYTTWRFFSICIPTSTHGSKHGKKCSPVLNLDERLGE